MEKIWRILFCAIISACSGQKPLDIPQAPPQEEQVEYIPVEKVVFRLNGEFYMSGEGNPSDTVKLYEEGLRTLEIVGYEPDSAAPPVIEAVNFYRDVYSFNYTVDSIYILGGSFAQPKNHYVSPVGEGLAGFVGKKIAPVGQAASHMLLQAQFYNYVNRTYDETVIDRGNGPETVKWSSVGKDRLYRVEVAVSVRNGAGEMESKSFFLPFYELENSVQIRNLQEGVMEVSPGDTVCLEKVVAAPPEFTHCEWVKGSATTRFNPLNGDAVLQAYQEMMEDPLLTEKGMLYTWSMVHLERDGRLIVDSRWNPQDARANGGAVYTTVPICVIMMPHGCPQSESFRRDFLFPDSTSYEVFPSPFFCNALVRIVY